MEHCVRVGTFGLSRKHILGSVEPGDKVACYATKEYKIIALGEATSTHYLDDSAVFLREGVYCDRIDFKASLLGQDNELDFMTIIDQMNFIKNLAYWSVYFSKGIVEITEHDWKVIAKKAKRSAPV